MSDAARLIGRAARVATAPVALTLACAATGLDVSLKVTSSVARGLGEAVAPAGSGSGAVAAVRELAGGTPVRRRWRSEDRCWIEVRGLDGEDGRPLGEAVLAAVRDLDGVRGAHLNHSVRRVVVSVDDDGPSMDELCQAVAAAESRHDPSDTDRRPSDLPGDGVVLTGRVVAAAANGAGLCVATAGWLLPWRPLPPGLAAARRESAENLPALR